MTALALLPALVLLAGQPMRGGLSVGPPLAGTASLAAIVAAFLPRLRSRVGRRLPVRLLATSALRRPPSDLPQAQQQAAEVREALDLPDAPEDDTPPGRREAIAGVLQRCQSAWGAPHQGPENLPDHQRLTLYLLLRLLKGDAAEAGHFARFFQRPAAILALRDEIDEMDRLRQRFDRDKAAYLATVALHRRQSGTPPIDLRAALASLGAIDIDLWHHVIARHDPHDPAQARAAFWCASQPECDRASVALYLARIARSGRLAIVSRASDRASVAALGSLIARWNDGAYTTAELGLDPVDMLLPAAQAFARTLDGLDRDTAEVNLPEPAGAFVAHPGRAPRARPAWDLATGRLTETPSPFDYIERPGTEG